MWTGIAIVFAFLYGLAGSIVSVFRFWQYEAFYFDFGIFDKAIWQVSRLRMPIIDHYIFGDRIIFGDHFSPTLFLLSPLYWITSRSEILFIVQALAVALSGLVLYFIGRTVLSKPWYAVALQLPYYLFVGLQNAVITDFHEITIATLFFMLSFLAVVKKNTILFLLSFLLFLGCKESFSVLGVGMAVAIWFIQPSWRWMAICTAIMSLAWGAISMKIVIPYFSGGSYAYNSELPTDPIRLVSSFIDSPVKQQTLWYTFLTFGFLPLLSPAFWALIIFDFVMRFYPAQMVTRWGLTFHYSALIAAIMAVASVYAVAFLQKKVKGTVVAAVLVAVVLVSGYLYRGTLHGPFGLAYNAAFYAHTKSFAFLNKVVGMIPKGASIMTQNNLAPHFAHQEVWLLLSQKNKQEYYQSKKPQYILLDNRPGQSPNNHFGIQDVELLLTHLHNDPLYEEIYASNGQFIFKRK